MIENQVRPEFRDDESVFAVRTLVDASYTRGALRLSVGLQDARVLGTDPDSAVTNSEVNAVEPITLKLGLLLAGGGKGQPVTRVEVGRTPLQYGSRRLIAADEFRNTLSSNTGVIFHHDDGRGKALDLFWAMPQERLPDDREGLLSNAVEFDHEGLDRQIWGLFAEAPQRIGKAGLGLAYVGFYERDRPGRPTRNRVLHTIGPRLLRPSAAGVLDYEVEGYAQVGWIAQSLAPAAPTVPVLAWFLHADAGYSFRHSWQPRLSFELDIASGDRPGGRFNRFDTILGMRRADFAPAGLYSTVGRTNIISSGLRAEARPTPRFDMMATYHAMWAESATDQFSTSGVRDPRGQSGRFAGHQFDHRLRYWLVANRLQAETNAVLLLRRDLLVDAPNAPDGRTTFFFTSSLLYAF